jgi:hypothetical protein
MRGGGIAGRGEALQLMGDSRASEAKKGCGASLSRGKISWVSMIHVDGEVEELQETTNNAPLPSVLTIDVFTTN